MSEDKLINGADLEAALDRIQRSRIGPETRMQCKVCWWIYDPAEGSMEWGAPPGTPFYDLPDEFTCPDCGHPRSSFIPADDDMG